MCHATLTAYLSHLPQLHLLQLQLCPRPAPWRIDLYLPSIHPLTTTVITFNNNVTTKYNNLSTHLDAAPELVARHGHGDAQVRVDDRRVDG